MSPQDEEQMIFELKPYTVTCAVCKTTETASEKELRASGWFLSRTELCPILNESHLSFMMGHAEALLVEVDPSYKVRPEFETVSCPF